ncbi:MAG TPA: hypothetical protein VLH08_04550 [Acidobacteriota bacterium]|nr:hypothetical protein [Acidobacteriota bacterium]
MTADTLSIVDDKPEVRHGSIINLNDDQTKNILIIMKVFCTIALFALISFPVFAEVSELIIQDGKISASFTSQPLGQTVRMISKQTGIQISIDDEVAGESVSASFKDLPLAIGIKKLLEGTGINYAVIAEGDGMPSAILISASEKPGTPPKKLDTRPTSTPANYPNRSVVTPVNPTPPPVPQVQPGGRGDMKQPGQQNAPGASGMANPNQPQRQAAPFQPVTPKFDPNNIPTAGTLVPSATPTMPQPDNKGAVLNNQNDENDEDDEEE